MVIELMELYRQAIMFCVWEDQYDRQEELNLRMQQILVKPHVLTILARIEDKRQKEMEVEDEPEEKFTLGG